MKNLSILSILLLAPAPIVAMEGQWKLEKLEKEKLQQPSKVPSLANLCLQSFSKIKDEELLLEQLPNTLLPENLVAGIWKNSPQEIIEAYNYELVEQLFELDYPATVKAIMVERLALTETQAQKLFDTVIDPENKQKNKHLVACALFVKNPELQTKENTQALSALGDVVLEHAGCALLPLCSDLQTWDIAQKIAASGPITLEAAKIIIHTTRFKWPRLVLDNGDNYFSEAMLCHNNRATFRQAILELIEEEQLDGPYIDEKSTLKELCGVFMWVPSCIGGHNFEELNKTERTRDEIKCVFDFNEETLNKTSNSAMKDFFQKMTQQAKQLLEDETIWHTIQTPEDIVPILYTIIPPAIGFSCLTDCAKFFKRIPVCVGSFTNDDTHKEHAHLVCEFIRKAQEHGFEVLPQEEEETEQ